MLFITDREPKGSIRETKNAKPFQFDLDKNAPANSVFFCERKDARKYSEIGGGIFMKWLKDSPSKQILLLIHGFSNLPEDHISPRVEAL